MKFKTIKQFLIKNKRQKKDVEQDDQNKKIEKYYYNIFILYFNFFRFIIINK